MGERKSSARRSYSAQFVLRQDLSGCKKPIETPIRDFGGESVKRGKEATEDSSVLVLEESESIETCKQVCPLSNNTIQNMVEEHSAKQKQKFNELRV